MAVIGGLALVSGCWVVYISFIGGGDGFCRSFAGLWFAGFCGSLVFQWVGVYFGDFGWLIFYSFFFFFKVVLGGGGLYLWVVAKDCACVRWC